MSSSRSVFPAGVIGLAIFLQTLTPTRIQANVYPSNLRLNGAVTNVPFGGVVTNVAISYVLNEDATAGAVISIRNGPTAVRTLTATNGGPGALRGTNVVNWDGKNDAQQSVPSGTYSVSVAAAAVGYTNWTQITSDTNEGNAVFEARGIAVNRNPSSPYYGRIYVANASEGPFPTNNPGDAVGILKLNADAS